MRGRRFLRPRRVGETGVGAGRGIANPAAVPALSTPSGLPGGQVKDLSPACPDFLKIAPVPVSSMIAVKSVSQSGRAANRVDHIQGHLRHVTSEPQDVHMAIVGGFPPLQASP